MPRYNDPAMSKTSRAEGAVREIIRARRVSVGRRIPSEAQICAELKISRKTARLAIRALVRNGILESRPGYGHVLKSTTAQRTIGITLGQVVTTSSGPIWTHLPMALRQDLDNLGFDARFYVLTGSGFPFIQDEEILVTDLEKGRLSAIVSVGVPLPLPGRYLSALDKRLAKGLREHRVPTTAYTSRDLPGTIGFDGRMEGRNAVAFMRSQGIIRPGLIVPAKSSNFVTRLIDGFCAALAENGIRNGQYHIFRAEGGDGFRQPGYKAFAPWWANMKQRVRDVPRGLIVPDDLLAEGVVYRALVSGVRIPEELVILAGGIKEAPPFLPCPHFRAEIDAALLARHLADLVVRLIKAPDHVPPRQWLKTQIVASRGAASFFP